LLNCGKGQPDRKRHTFSGCAFNEDLALMLSDDIVTDGQPQASAVSLRGKEWIENKGHGLLGYKRACIMEIHAHALTILVEAQTYRELSALIRFHRFHGIQA
jgi:hypothetical protein